jgi:hypothetical protein
VVKLSDIAGILSRPFVVGFFTPAVIAWASVVLLTLGDQPKRFESLSLLHKVLAVVILAALTAALLSVLRYEIRSAFTTGNLLPRRLRERWKWKEWERFDKLDADKPEQLSKRDLHFPEEDQIGPTRFGNVFGGYQAYPSIRFGLDYHVAWKRIDVLLSPREVELQALARSDVDALLNLAALAIPAALAVLVDRLVHPSPIAAAALGIVGLGIVFYHLAVRAELRLGNEQRASFDMHRFELYRRFGAHWPAYPSREKDIAHWVSAVMLWPGYELPPKLWSSEYPSGR